VQTKSQIFLLCVNTARHNVMLGVKIDFCCQLVWKFPKSLCNFILTGFVFARSSWERIIKASSTKHVQQRSLIVDFSESNTVTLCSRSVARSYLHLL